MTNITRRLIQMITTTQTPRITGPRTMLSTTSIRITMITQSTTTMTPSMRMQPRVDGHDDDEGHDHEDVAHAAPAGPYAGDWYTLGEFGKLKMSIGYYIDALTVCMFCMVTLIASCIHFYATGYMHDELHDFTDPEVTMSDGCEAYAAWSLSTVLPVVVVVLLQHAGARGGRQYRHDIRLLGAGRDLFLLSDWFLRRAKKCLDGGKQGVHCQPRR